MQKTPSTPFLTCAKGLKKASCFLQNDALIAILVVKGREVVFWKACDELCHVVGSGKTRIRKSTRKKRRKKWFLVSNLRVFQAKPWFGPDPDLAGNLR